MPGSTDGLARKRRRMVEAQIAARGVRNTRVLEAMRAVPREAFVPEELAEFAYEDGPLPIGAGQTISQPYVVALMAELAYPGSREKVLDVGTGSGYAAAVMSRMAARVYTIERHPELAETARRRLERLGYDNIEVRCGDGTLGWPEAAPFDAIVVAAGGPEVPQALREQLEVGGRLAIPVASDGAGQKLLLVRRTAADTFEEEDCGAVAFVPLVGEQGWREGARDLPSDPLEPPRAAFARPMRHLRPGNREPAGLIAAAAEALPDLADADFGRVADRFGEARLVLMGEATHGTSEFYRARAELTKRLIVKHGYTVIAVEADWPDAARIDRYVRGRADGADGMAAFTRFPTWMWRNAEVSTFLDWLHSYNQTIAAPEQRVGFYGLDLYSLNASIAGVLDYLDRHDPEAAQLARERYGCLTPWQHDPASYGRAALRPGFRTCERAVLAMLGDLLIGRLDDAVKDGESFLDAAQNARLVAAAERYYRTMYYGAAESWNLRDRHMFETLQAVLAARGPGTKAVVWAHNSHIGDARATEMGKIRDELNIGQLCREAYGAKARLLGFGTDRGTVAAASNWDGPMEIKDVRPAHEDSYEWLCGKAGGSASCSIWASEVRRRYATHFCSPGSSGP
jgi:protein-L-isoaspartate(D-aspartate) O-methyltransferase